MGISCGQKKEKRRAIEETRGRCNQQGNHYSTSVELCKYTNRGLIGAAEKLKVLKVVTVHYYCNCKLSFSLMRCWECSGGVREEGMGKCVLC